MTQLLNNKVCLVTGGASGIGRAAALRFAREGALVAVVDISEQRGGMVCDEIIRAGGASAYFSCDISNPEQVRLAVEDAVARFGRLDILFANAGINGVWAPIEDLAPDEWDRTHSVNLKGTFLTVHFAIPHLRRAGGGSVIINSSVNGNRTFSNAGASAYAASKAGQIGFMKMAALELGRYGIRVNAICPGAIHTQIDESTTKRNVEGIQYGLEMPGGNPALNRGQGEADDVAGACVFLASDLSRHVSGIELYIDGGFSLLT